jgi:RNA polymerase sigma factor (sigma-70 family)
VSQRSEKERALDAYLAAAARVGDRAALGRLVDRWQGKLLAHAWRLTGDRELANDVVQEVWVDVIRGIGSLLDEDAFAAWAFRIVTRRCARAIGSLQRQREGKALLLREPEAQPDPVSQAETPAEMAIVRAAMAELPADQRAALALFYLEGLRVAEIAVALDVPVGTIKTRLMHARNALRARLEGEDDEQAG